MWFGDLVTMRWWNGIWLNEAFATFMEIAACDAYRPDWDRWTTFGLERTVAFETDSLASTRPVEFEVRSPADCEGMFDVLTYQKGGALLRMLEQYLGVDRFRAGVSHYLRTHSYANTETNDLWDAIEATSGEPVRRIMDSWIWQPGYPIVSASLVTADGSTALSLSQQRFRFETDDSADRPVWAIPVHVRNGGVTTSVLLDGTTLAAPVALADPDGPVIVNAGGHGFFRVDYADELRSRLDGEVLGSMSTLERYNLVDDAWSSTLARPAVGRGVAGVPRRIPRRAATTRSGRRWSSPCAVSGGSSATTRTRRSRRSVRSLVVPALERLGEPADDDTDLTSKLRGLLVGAAGVLGNDVATQARCREWYDAASRDATTRRSRNWRRPPHR